MLRNTAQETNYKYRLQRMQKLNTTPKSKQRKTRQNKTTHV